MIQAVCLLNCGSKPLIPDPEEFPQADMIVVGSHGHGAVYDVLIGSYSAGIIRGSELPVVVVPVREG